MLDPKVVVILAILAGGYYVGSETVHGLKALGHKIAHVFHHPPHDSPIEP